MMIFAGGYVLSNGSTPRLLKTPLRQSLERAMALPPMEYLLAWRMAVAKDLLRRHDVSVGEVAERVGYGSASTFSTAFSRHVGRLPGRYAREGSRHDNPLPADIPSGLLAAWLRPHLSADIVQCGLRPANY